MYRRKKQYILLSKICLNSHKFGPKPNHLAKKNFFSPKFVSGVIAGDAIKKTINWMYKLPRRMHSWPKKALRK